MQKTYHVLTFGCQMNENDSEKLSGLLESEGYLYEEDVNKADIVVVNTCSVRESAERRAIGNIGQLKTNKKKNPEMILAVCGCMAQRPEIVKYLNEKHPEIDIIFGTHNLSDFPRLLREFLKTREKSVNLLESSTSIAENIPTHRRYPFKSYVTIMQGCNNFCSYCIVPYTRGRERSRTPEKIIEEIESLVDDGVLEITLLGQNVNSYGKDLEEKINFAELLNRIARIKGLERIRFISSNPKDFTDDIIEAIAENKNVMPSIHLALQSGSTEVLKRMNRPYSKEEAIDLISRIKKRVPEIAITTDIIVGFPGETEEDFLDTIDLVEQCQFDNAFSFIYSKRSGTKAAEMPNQIDDRIKHERIERLLKVLKKEALNNNLKYEGNTYPVLIEELNKKDTKKVSGRTETGKLVHLEGDETLIGKILPVKITKAGAYALHGELERSA